MKKIMILFSIPLLFLPQILLAEVCEKPSSGEEYNKLTCSMSIIALKASGDNQSAKSKESEADLAKLKAAEAFVKANRKNTNFEEKDAREFITNLTSLSENKKYDVIFRSKVIDAMAGLHGIISEKRGTDGVDDGKKAFNYLDEALKLDPKNKHAVRDFAEAIIEVYDRGPFIRTLAESSLGLNINIKKMAETAKSKLEDLNLKDDPLHQKISEILKDYE